MTTALKSRLAGPPAAYMALVRRFPLYPIRTTDEYDKAAEILDVLVMKDADELKPGEAEYRDALDLLIESYDDAHFPEPEHTSPLARLVYLLAQSGTNVTGLGAILGSQPLASMVLSGKRELSKSAILKLAAHFNVDPGYFI